MKKQTKPTIQQVLVQDARESIQLLFDVLDKLELYTDKDQTVDRRYEDTEFYEVRRELMSKIDSLKQESNELYSLKEALRRVRDV